MPFLDEMFSDFSREIEERKEKDSHDANESMRRCLTEVTVKLNHSLEELSETKRSLKYVTSFFRPWFANTVRTKMETSII